jgi:hypothetical protein
MTGNSNGPPGNGPSQNIEPGFYGPGGGNRLQRPSWAEEHQS